MTEPVKTYSFNDVEPFVKSTSIEFGTPAPTDVSKPTPDPLDDWMWNGDTWVRPEKEQ